MEIIDKVPRKLWDDIVLNADGATYFHTYEWTKIIEQSFPNYSIVTKVFIFDDDVKAILPLMQSKRFFGLRKLYISMVPGVYGGLISNNRLTNEQIVEIYNHVVKKCSNLRIFGNPFIENYMPPFFHKGTMFTHVLDLENGFKIIWKNYSKGHRYNAKKAKKDGVYVKLGESLEDYKKYYDIYEDSLKRWGDNATSRYEFNLFENIYNLKSKNIKLFLALIDEKIVSGALLFYCGNHIVWWHGATLSDFFNHYPANFLQNEIIKESCEKGYKYYDFNPSGGHEGVMKFKDRFGAKRIYFNIWTKK
ncbi:MAG: peptidoglycan bridge formation glycyltransferase FemA/FemB family protein [Candidatus Methanomarinus sp.]|uniref:Peptidoglycan bridge formation glycyltransferase FemA/FemB family protein n=1 Tax=Candidatus Methanomarinus sp. TaxID=3386244 RepID=A0AC61SDT0_9EURY|nr:Lipid II:glycine glycyltransferase (Peptidoglycan interpeptide bridge formation enzyme) [ANME-2 cluster archaeon]TKY92469.1 MAG: peptidoglycan bridge formation glycyltransferase FemA/FemB family protein [ANME-2 cluster archaeon]